MFFFVISGENCPISHVVAGLLIVGLFLNNDYGKTKHFAGWLQACFNPFSLQPRLWSCGRMVFHAAKPLSQAHKLYGRKCYFIF